MENKTVMFSEEVKGWTSFHTFQPEFMLGMNSQFFSFKGGDLFVHHSDDVPRNTYYGDQKESKVSVMINDSPSDIKAVKAVSLEGNYSWDTLITAFVSNIDSNVKSTITSAEFIKKEGIWYAYARRNEDSKQIDSKAAYGIGRITKVEGNTMRVNGSSSVLVAGDVIVKSSDMSILGEVTSTYKEDGETVINLTSIGTATIGDFIFGTKNPRVEGGTLRGYTVKLDLSLKKNDKIELFAVNAEVMKSNP